MLGDSTVVLGTVLSKERLITPMKTSSTARDDYHILTEIVNLMLFVLFFLVVYASKTSVLGNVSIGSKVSPKIFRS